MKTLLIRGTTEAPAALREIIERGSTAVHDRRASDTDLRGSVVPDADRIVFWHAAGEREVSALADRYLANLPDREGDVLVFVTPDAAEAPKTLAPHQLFRWPDDEERLEMAFMTGA